MAAAEQPVYAKAGSSVIDQTSDEQGSPESASFTSVAIPARLNGALAVTIAPSLGASMRTSGKSFRRLTLTIRVVVAPARSVARTVSVRPPGDVNTWRVSAVVAITPSTLER